MKVFLGFLLLAFLLAWRADVVISERPPRDRCAPRESLIDQCKASPDCSLNPRELMLWREHQEMLDLMCPDRENQ